MLKQRFLDGLVSILILMTSVLLGATKVWYEYDESTL